MVRLWTLFLTFLKIGFLGFGGGYAMLSLIYEESVTLGLTIEQFADLNALDVLVPGPIAINSATYVGYISQGFLGSLLATIGVSIPSFILVAIFLKSENLLRNNPYLASLLTTVKSASVGLIASVALTLGISSIFPEGISLRGGLMNSLSKMDVFSAVVIFVVGFAHIKYKVSPILLTFLAGLAGLILYYI